MYFSKFWLKDLSKVERFFKNLVYRLLKDLDPNVRSKLGKYQCPFFSTYLARCEITYYTITKKPNNINTSREKNNQKQTNPNTEMISLNSGGIPLQHHTVIVSSSRLPP